MSRGRRESAANPLELASSFSQATGCEFVGGISVGASRRTLTKTARFGFSLSLDNKVSWLLFYRG